MSEAEVFVNLDGRVYVSHDNHSTWQVWHPPIPEGAMRVAPGTDAVVWRINPGSTGEL